MPNRILKESICTSDTIQELSPEEEIFWYRLIVTCDDYGRMDARPAILRARLFPLKLDRISEADVSRWLTRLAEVGLITLYKSNNHPYLQAVTWEKHQQIRAKRSKYPDPVDGQPVQVQAPAPTSDTLKASAIGCNQMLSHVPVIQSESESESNPNPTIAAEASSPPFLKSEKRPEVIKRPYSAFEQNFMHATGRKYLRPGERDLIQAAENTHAPPVLEAALKWGIGAGITTLGRILTAADTMAKNKPKESKTNGRGYQPSTIETAEQAQEYAKQHDGRLPIGWAYKLVGDDLIVVSNQLPAL